jgi:hypothetical protein
MKIQTFGEANVLGAVLEDKRKMFPRPNRNESRISLSDPVTVIVLTVLALVCAVTGNRALGSPLPDVPGKVDELSNFLQNRQITRIEILHVPDNLETRTRVSPEVLRKISRTRAILENPWESAHSEGLITSLNEVKSAKTRETGEIRWGILFFDAGGKEISAIYLSSDGSLGIFQGVSLSLTGRVLNWAKSSIRSAFST